ncbi:MAG: CHASE domain-containing protein [Myxococcota bacterium]
MSAPRPRPSTWVPVAVFVVLMGLTTLASRSLRAADERAVAADFVGTTREIEAHAAERLETLVALLRGGSALFTASAEVDRHAFTSWVARLELREHYPALHGIGFSMVVPLGAADAVEARAHAEGLADFRVWPEPTGDATTILYIEPLGQNAPALGYDMYSERVRAEAMDRARDTGDPTLSGPVHLVQEPDPARPHGLLCYVPVYGGDAVPSDVAARRAALRGFVYGAMRAPDLFGDLFGGAVPVGIGVTVRDTRGTVLAAIGEPASPGPLARRAELSAHGQTWEIEYRAGPGFGVRDQLVPITFVVGALAAVACAGGVGVVMRARERSDALAADLARSRTALVDSEAHLRDSEARMRAVVETIPQIVFVADGAGGFEQVNRRWAEATGRPAESALGRGWLEAVHPDDRDRADRVLASLKAGRALAMELRLATPDGGWRWYHAAALPAPADGDEEARLFGAFTDVDALRRAEIAMREAQRLESVGLLAGGVAHDFNNLLTAITGYGSLAERVLAADHPARPMVGRMVEAARHAAHLTRQLLAYAGKGRFFVEKLDLVTLARETADLLRGAVTRNVAMEVSLPDAPAWVEADAGQMRQVVLNLVLNAAQAIGDAPGTVRVSVEADGRDVRLRVRDDGAGMDAETRARIFEPFFSTRGEGRGLGLAAVFGIVKGHAGTIDVTSEPGRGSEFVVRLPQRPAPSVTSQPPAPVRAAGAVSALIVDDEASVRDVALRALRARGWRADAVASGEEALEALGARRGHWRVVVLDLVMPGLGGPETLAAIRRDHPGLRVLVTSGYGEEEALRRLAANAPEGFCAKPFTEAELCDAVARVAALRPARAAP